ncbi:MAG: hypothetical protein SGPRY_002955 [Prymnesium sp.]
MASLQSAWAWTNQQTDSRSSVGPSASQTAPTPTADVVKQHQMRRYEAIILTEVQDWLSHVIDKVALDTSVQGSGVRASRMKWNRKRKATIVNSYVKVATEFSYESQKRAIKRIKEQVHDNAKQFESRAVRHWLAHGPSFKRGRKCNAEFELHILDELVSTSLAKVNGREQAAVIANICYSHDLIILAAKMVQGRPQWKVVKLTNAMRPRRITAQAKQLPPPEKVQEVMLDIQKTIVEGVFTLAEIFNGDASGMFYEAPPKQQDVPLSADRAMAPESDENSRFTAFLWGSAEEPDERQFLAENGWELKQWARDMVLSAGKQENEAGEAMLETKKCATLQCVHTSLETENFKQSMRKTFVKVGLAKDEVDTFAVYAAHKKAGWLRKTLFGEVHVNEIRAHMAETAVPVDSPEEGILTLGEVATDFVIELRDESRMPLPLEVPDDEDEEEESQQACGSED